MPPPMKYRCHDPEETLAIKHDRGNPSGPYGRGTWEAKVSGKHLALGPRGPAQGPPRDHNEYNDEYSANSLTPPGVLQI